MADRRGILVAWFAVLGTVAFGLHALGAGALAGPPLQPGQMATWLAERDPLIATFAVLRVLVLVACWYLVVVTAAGIVTRWLRADHLAVALDRLTVPLVRGLVHHTAGVSMATVLVAAPTPALAVSPAADVVAAPVVASPVVPRGLLPALPGLVHEPAGPEQGSLFKWEIGTGSGDEAVAEPHPPADPATPQRDATASADAGDTHLVRPGDSLWRIASDHLEASRGYAPSDEEVAPVWRRVIELNRDRLVDPDDPDLILPGQELLVPPGVAP